MFSADFPLQFEAGLHARPLGHLTNLGLTIDGKALRADNPEMAEYEYPQSQPDRVVRLAADTGDPEHDRRLVQYGKATIQSGDGPFRHVVHPMSPQPEHIAGAVQSLESNPDWAPYMQVDQQGGERAAKKVVAQQPAKREMYKRVTAAIDCPKCGARISAGTSHCSACGEPISDPNSDDNGPERFEHYDHKDAGWHEVAAPLTQFQSERGDFAGANGPTGEALCPNCGTLNPPGSSQCMKCGAKIGLTQPSHSGGPSNAYSNPFTGNPPVASVVSSEMSKWHLADLGAPDAPMQTQPDTQDGPFNDHRDVSEMSHEQAVGHERLVNIVVDEMNKVLSQGGQIDATLVDNLVQWLVDKFGQDADSAQAIVDAASKQAQTSDGRLDTPVVPDPAEQAIQPAQGDVVTDPNAEQNSGAFQGPYQAHVRTPSGRVGHVVETWEDMYGEKWAMVACDDGYRESAYEDELIEEETPEPENAVKELHDFIESLEPVEASVASVKARIANMRILKQEIRRHMTNPRLTHDQKLALDQMDADASIDMLALTDAVTAMSAKEEMYLASQPKFALTMSEDVQPTMFGVEHLALDEAPEPEWSEAALDAFLPEEAEVFASELDPALRADATQLEAVAASHVDGMTLGHSEEVRAHHRSRFVANVKTVAADYATTDEPDTIEEGDWDGPAEGIFN